MDLASALASNVLPTPGTSSMSTCPSASSTVIASLIASGLPEVTVSTAALTRWATGTSSSSLLLSAWFPVSTTTCPPRVTLGALLGPPAELRSVGRRGRASDSTTCGAAHATRAHPPAAGLAPPCCLPPGHCARRPTIVPPRHCARRSTIVPPRPPSPTALHLRARHVPLRAAFGQYARFIPPRTVLRRASGPVPPSPFPTALHHRDLGLVGESGSDGRSGSLTVGECGVQWRAVGQIRPQRSARVGDSGGEAGVSRHSHAPPGRQGEAVPAREVPRRARARTSPDQGPGAVHLRVPAVGVRPDHRGAADRAGDRQGRQGLQPGLLRQRVRRDAGQAGPDHDPARAAGVRGAAA